MTIAGLAIAGCASAAAPAPSPSPSPQAAVGQVAGGPGWPGWIAPAVAAKAVDFRGTCTWGRSVGEARRYRVKVRVVSALAVSVRADARFEAGDGSNVIGELASGTEVLADGPLYGGQGMGYAVPVRGHSGRVCRGYIPATAVAVSGLDQQSRSLQ